MAAWHQHFVGPAAGRTALVLAALITLPFCFSGIFVDDSFQVLAVERLGVGYVALYRFTGSGSYGSEIYVDPLREPVRFLTAWRRPG